VDGEIRHLMSDYVADKIIGMRSEYLPDFLPYMTQAQRALECTPSAGGISGQYHDRLKALFL